MTEIAQPLSAVTWKETTFIEITKTHFEVGFVNLFHRKPGIAELTPDEIRFEMFAPKEPKIEPQNFDTVQFGWLYIYWKDRLILMVSKRPDGAIQFYPSILMETHKHN